MPYNTFFGGLFVHLITIFPWLLGGFGYVAAIWILYEGRLVEGTCLLAFLLLQYVVPGDGHWPGFGAWLRKLNPRAYYTHCELHLPPKGIAAIRDSKSLLSYHPHGCLCLGFSWNGAHAEELLSKEFKWLVVDALTVAPLFGWICRWMKTIQGASPKHMTKLMQRGDNVALLPGGFEEATIMKFNVDRVYLKNRKGFIKYALRFGYRVHPVYTFGESESYYTFSLFPKFRMQLNRFKIPAILFWGTPLLPILPRTNVVVNTFIGESIELPKIPNPTKDDVSKWHAIYCEKLKELFDSKKSQAGRPPDAELEIW